MSGGDRGAGCDWQPPPVPGSLHPALLDPWDAATGFGPGTVVAVLTATEGPSYRSLGAAIAIAADGRMAGSITSGCIEGDLALRARAMGPDAAPLRLRYGAGSPFFDLRLPCGGAVEVTLFPLRDADVLAELAARRAARAPVALHLSAEGRLRLGPWRPAGVCGAGFATGFRPPVRYIILGAGPEALVFARLAAALGRDHLLLSHDAATLASAGATGCRAARLTGPGDVEGLGIDARTAVLLFFHDHDHEPDLLRRLLATDAFYIGAQGSRGAQRARLARLADLGVPSGLRARLRGPIGLIPSTRDPQTLAISVLAEIAEAEAARDRAIPMLAAE